MGNGEKPCSFAELRGVHPCYDPAKDIVVPSWRWKSKIPDDDALGKSNGDMQKALALEEARPSL